MSRSPKLNYSILFKTQFFKGRLFSPFPWKWATRTPRVVHISTTMWTKVHQNTLTCALRWALAGDNTSVKHKCSYIEIQPQPLTTFRGNQGRFWVKGGFSIFGFHLWVDNNIQRRICSRCNSSESVSFSVCDSAITSLCFLTHHIKSKSAQVKFWWNLGVLLAHFQEKGGN